jgi:VanZ family protein
MGAPSLDWLEQLEHDLAYFGTALFLTMGFRTTRNRVATISLLVGLAAVMELIQRMVPGRHSQFIDWFASSSGAGVGVFAIILLERVLTPCPAAGRWR